jgi:predicted unusual protein kinase regulating ubiquinone biosynthesis (AarF/ABC1/UbiB family)
MQFLYKCIDHSIFLFHIGWIFLSESFSYFFSENYTQYICNITQRLVKTNVLCVKVFQAFAQNQHIIDSKMNDELLKYTDHAPWDNHDISWETIFNLEEKYDLDFGDYHPINSGMISIVFKTKDKKTDQFIIIKMKRESIEIHLKRAIQQLLFLAYLFSFFPSLREMELEKIIQKNIELLYSQLDFKNEIENIYKIRTNYKNIDYVKIPIPYPEVTNDFPNVIMMEFIDGKKITEIDPADSIYYAKLCTKFSFTNLLIHGLGHADLHCGNILFLKDSCHKHQIGILDFGILFTIDCTLRNKLLEVFIDIFQEDHDITAKRFLYSGLLEPLENIEKIPEIHQEKIIYFISHFFIKSSIQDRNKIQVNIYKSITELKEYLEKHQLNHYGIRPSDSFLKMQLSLAMNDGILSSFNKFNDMIGIMDSVITEMFHLDLLLENED